MGTMAKSLVETKAPFRQILQEVAVLLNETPYDLVTMIEDDGVDDPLHALAGIGNLRRWLETQEEDFVIKALAEGRSWGQIAKMLQRSKQAVWEKHRDPEDRIPD